MSALTLNSIAVPVSVEGWGSETTEVGQRSRSVSGKSLVTVSRVYRKYKGIAITTDAELAAALSGLINGDPIGWSFDADWYADGKGLGPTTTGTTPTIVATDGAVSPKYGAKFLKCPASATARWTHGLGSTKFGASVWAYVSGAWHHYAIRSDTMGTGHWYDGSWVASTQTLLTASATHVQVGAAGAAVQFDDLLSFPFLPPTSWLIAIAAQSAAWPKPPTLTAAGDLMTYGSASVRGQVQRSDYTNRGALDAMQKIAFTLEED